MCATTTGDGSLNYRHTRTYCWVKKEINNISPPGYHPHESNSEQQTNGGYASAHASDRVGKFTAAIFGPFKEVQAGIISGVFWLYVLCHTIRLLCSDSLAHISIYFCYIYIRRFYFKWSWMLATQAQSASRALLVKATTISKTASPLGRLALTIPLEGSSAYDWVTSSIFYIFGPVAHWWVILKVCLLRCILPYSRRYTMNELAFIHQNQSPERLIFKAPLTLYFTRYSPSRVSSCISTLKCRSEG